MDLKIVGTMTEDFTLTMDSAQEAVEEVLTSVEENLKEFFAQKAKCVINNNNDNDTKGDLNSKMASNKAQSITVELNKNSNNNLKVKLNETARDNLNVNTTDDLKSNLKQYLSDISEVGKEGNSINSNLKSNSRSILKNNSENSGGNSKIVVKMQLKANSKESLKGIKDIIKTPKESSKQARKENIKETSKLIKSSKGFTKDSVKDSKTTSDDSSNKFIKRKDNSLDVSKSSLKEPINDSTKTANKIKLDKLTDDTNSNDTATAAPLVKLSKEAPRRAWMTTERMSELRHRAQDAIRQNKTFTIRGCFNSIRQALIGRGWVEKLDVHRKHTLGALVCQVSYDDLTQTLPKRKAGETRRQYIAKCEQNIMSRFLEHVPIDFLWTNRKEKCDYIDQTRNPGMTINKFQRAPFTSKEGLCSQLRDFHWYYEEGTAELCFPRCYNVWSPEELNEFVENYKLTACVAFVRWLVDTAEKRGNEAVFAAGGKVPLSCVDFVYKRCREFIDGCQHNDIDLDEAPKVWEHEWELFLSQHQQVAQKGEKVCCAERSDFAQSILKNGARILAELQQHWPQYTLDGYHNLWIVKPANKCRGRGIQLMDNLKDIINVVKPLIVSKSRYVVQKYIERPLIIHHTKFDIRQWFLVTNVQPLVLWMYKECYLRFSSQEYNLSNYHESVHLTNHAVQKKYTNGKRDKRLPTENMWDSYSFQAYLRQIGCQDMWLKRIYPGMRKAIIGTMLASQELMDRRPNTFELFGADFMICEAFYPWLIEINSSPDLGATTSVTARMCPQCLEDVIKVVIDRRADPKADGGNFELIYRQNVPTTPAYMGLNLVVKGQRIAPKGSQNSHICLYGRKERSYSSSNSYRRRLAVIGNTAKEAMPTFNATEACRGRLSTSAFAVNMAQLCDYNTTLQRAKSAVVIPTSPSPKRNSLRRKSLKLVTRKTNKKQANAMPIKSATTVTPPVQQQRAVDASLNSASKADLELIVQKWAFQESSKPTRPILERKSKYASTQGLHKIANTDTESNTHVMNAIGKRIAAWKSSMLDVRTNKYNNIKMPASARSADKRPRRMTAPLLAFDSSNRFTLEK